MIFEWTVAVRFLREGRTQTALILGGAAVGVAVVIFITGILKGVQSDLIQRTLGSQAHVTIKPPEGTLAPLTVSEDRLTRLQARPQRVRTIDNWPRVLRDAQATSGVVAVSPTVSGSALAIKGDASRSISVLGIELERYNAVVDLAGKLVRGVLRAQAGDAIIGTTLADDLSVDVGDRIRIQAAGERSETLTVRGIVDLGNRDANRRAYVELRMAQSLFNIAGNITNIDIAISDVFAANQVATRLQSQSGQLVENWIQTSSFIFNAINNQNIMTLLIRVFVAVVVVLGIASVLVVSVVQKRKEIGILRAMGASRARILRVFLLQGALLGAGGAAIGGALGYLLIRIFSRILVSPLDGKPLFAIAFDPELMLIAFAAATLLGLLAAVIPARGAAQLDPAEAIRL